MQNKQRIDCKSAGLCQSGFTLLEVLLAVMILGLSITAILFQFQVALRAGSSSKDNTQAVVHAREKLEELKTQKKFSLVSMLPVWQPTQSMARPEWEPFSVACSSLERKQQN